MSRVSVIQKLVRPANNFYKLLSGSELENSLAKFPTWKYTSSDGAMKSSIQREFRFDDFYHTRSFIQNVLESADKLDHHPELKNVYTTVQIVYNTHDAGGLTELDFMMAEETEKALETAMKQ